MVTIVDVSPVRSRTTFDFDRHHQSVSGKALCVAMSTNGERVYVGGHSGVWRSDDGGITWWHPERPQPPAGSTAVAGAMLPPAVYDLLVDSDNADNILAATGRDSRVPSQNAIYRSTDGAQSWSPVHRFTDWVGRAGMVGTIAASPGNTQLVFAAGQFAVGVSADGGATWSERSPQGTSGDSVFHLAVSAAVAGGERYVYAVGTRFWFSRDAGATWTADATILSADSPSDSLGYGARCLCVDPLMPRRVYFAREAGELWRGDLPAAGNGAMAWTLIVAPSIDYGGTTASGTDFVHVHLGRARTRQFLFSDRRTVHVAIGEPTQISDWTRIDASPVHVDPHGIAVTPDFSAAKAGAAAGRMAIVNDGGAVISTTGGANWEFGTGLSTLGLVNTAVLPRRDKQPALVIQMGDNNGFFSSDGGLHWRTQDYRGGDNDCSFADPRQPERLIVFAPRHGSRAIFLYSASAGNVPNGAWGTDDRQIIPSPPVPANKTKGQWNAVSNFYNLGYRPLVLTLDGEDPIPGGDFITIVTSDDDLSARLLRTTRLNAVTASAHWTTTATADGPSVKVFAQGPVLPNPRIGVVQATGGHANPIFFVSDAEESASQGLWTWQRGQSEWRRIVPSPPNAGPQRARRFFVDPYRPAVVYVLDVNQVWRSDNGGSTWMVDTPLATALTEGGAFPLNLMSEAGAAQTLLRDMVFDPTDAGWRVAIGPAGVFLTLDGRTWRHLLLSSAAGMRPINAVLDRISTPCARMLYVSTSNRGVLRLGPLPPDWQAVPDGVSATVGVVTLLRVHSVATGYGPPGDQLDAEVIVHLDSEPGRSFGFQLRTDPMEADAEGKLALLRDAFDVERRVRLEFIRTGCTVGRIIRVAHEGEKGSNGTRELLRETDAAART